MAETTETARFDALTPAHLDGAVALSRVEGWPHRRDASGLAARGLAPVGDWIAMIRGDAPAPASKFHSFALAAQALG